ADVRGGAHRGVPRLRGGPALHAGCAAGAGMAGGEQEAGLGARGLALRAAPFVSGGLLAAAWGGFARSRAGTPLMLAALSTVLERIWTDAVAGDLWINTGVTLYRAFTGFAIAAVLGIALGFAMARSRIAHWFFDPIVSVGFPMPKIAFLPIVGLWLGL